MIICGFTDRQTRSELSDRLPPGQHLVDNLPVLAAGPTLRKALRRDVHAEARTSSGQSVELAGAQRPPTNQGDATHPLCDLLVEAQYRSGERNSTS
jgi:hypothetical protein